MKRAHRLRADRHALIRAAADPARDDAIAVLVREHVEVFVCRVPDRGLHFGDPLFKCIAGGDDLAGRCDAIILGHEFVDRAQVVRRRPKRVERNRTLIAGRVRESMRSFYLSDAALTAEDA